jgi:hypothetical protein
MLSAFYVRDPPEKAASAYMAQHNQSLKTFPFGFRVLARGRA